MSDELKRVTGIIKDHLDAGYCCVSMTFARPKEDEDDTLDVITSWRNDFPISLRQSVLETQLKTVESEGLSVSPIKSAGNC